MPLFSCSFWCLVACSQFSLAQWVWRALRVQRRKQWRSRLRLLRPAVWRVHRNVSPRARDGRRVSNLMSVSKRNFEERSNVRRSQLRIRVFVFAWDRERVGFQFYYLILFCLLGDSPLFILRLLPHGHVSWLVFHSSLSKHLQRNKRGFHTCYWQHLTKHNLCGAMAAREKRLCLKIVTVCRLAESTPVLTLSYLYWHKSSQPKNCERMQGCEIPSTMCF